MLQLLQQKMVLLKNLKFAGVIKKNNCKIKWETSILYIKLRLWLLSCKDVHYSNRDVHLLPSFQQVR